MDGLKAVFGAITPVMYAPVAASLKNSDATGSDPGDRPGDRAVAAPHRAEAISEVGKPESAAALSRDGLTPEERQLVEQLKARHAEVVRHEQAHARVGGEHAGQPRYSYTTGPDGNRYATGGEVAIDVSSEDEPEATISKMEVVKQAALAPPEPSAQDRRVAQIADSIRMQAQAELLAERMEARRSRLLDIGGAEPVRRIPAPPAEYNHLIDIGGERIAPHSARESALKI